MYNVPVQQVENVKNDDYKFQNFRSLKEVDQYIKQIVAENKDAGEVWVIFDIDETLTTRLLKDGDKVYEFLGYGELRPISDFIKNEEEKFVFSRWVSWDAEVFIEPNTVEIFRTLRRKNLRMFLCTAMESKMRFTRLKFLKKIGLDFSDAFDFSEKVLDDCPKVKGEHPMYDQGCIFANGKENKGIDIKSFIEKVDKKPACVIVVDDRKANLDNIYEALSDIEGIKYLPVLFSYQMSHEQAPEEVLKRYLRETYVRFQDYYKENTPDW